MHAGGSASATVVCVHGAGGGGWEWAIWARVLAAYGFGVLAPDLSPVAAGLAETRFADYRAQVAAWCRAADAPCVLVGASLGGLLALAVAGEVDAAALVLVNPMPCAGVPPVRAGHAHAGVVRWGRGRTLAGTRRALPDADDAARLHALRRWRDESGAVLDEAGAGIAVAPPGCPVLVLASGRDTDVPPATSRALAMRFDADFELVVQASHVGPLLGRSAATVAERAADWLRERLAARAV